MLSINNTAAQTFLYIVLIHIFVDFYEVNLFQDETVIGP